MALDDLRAIRPQGFKNPMLPERPEKPAFSRSHGDDYASHERSADCLHTYICGVGDPFSEHPSCRTAPAQAHLTRSDREGCKRPRRMEPQAAFARTSRAADKVDRFAVIFVGHRSSPRRRRRRVAMPCGTGLRSRSPTITR